MADPARKQTKKLILELLNIFQKKYKNKQKTLRKKYLLKQNKKKSFWKKTIDKNKPKKFERKIKKNDRMSIFTLLLTDNLVCVRA